MPGQLTCISSADCASRPAVWQQTAAGMAMVLREADRLWRGPALAGIRGDWIARMRHSLEEERRAAIVERVECELALGRHTDLVGELGGLLAQYPLDETFIACQMTALYRAGRTSDALGLYIEARSRLIDEQGTEPGPALAELHQRILRHDPELFARPLRAEAGEPLPDPLPPATQEFTGRDQEFAVLAEDRSDSPRIVVIQGAAGAGKTQFAIRAARILADYYPDGTLYLDLRAQDPVRPPLGPGEALTCLLRALGVPAAQIPHTLADLAASWRAQLSRRVVVVILDGAIKYDQVSPLLPVAGRCLFLITAQRELPGLQDARVFTLGLLPHEDAVSLFARITGTVGEGGPMTATKRQPRCSGAGACH